MRISVSHTMSRSTKNIPIVGNTKAPSDKPYKVREHRRERRRAAVDARLGDDPPSRKKYGGAWNSEKDGKHYWPNPLALRK